jgi:hypothetical protein
MLGQMFLLRLVLAGHQSIKQVSHIITQLLLSFKLSAHARRYGKHGMMQLVNS